LSAGIILKIVKKYRILEILEGEKILKMIERKKIKVFLANLSI